MVGKPSPYRLQKRKTHSWAPKIKKGRDRKEEREREMESKGEDPLPFLKLPSIHMIGKDRREGRDPAPCPLPTPTISSPES